jgi:hypothetical protein
MGLRARHSCKSIFSPLFASPSNFVLTFFAKGCHRNVARLNSIQQLTWQSANLCGGSKVREMVVNTIRPGVSIWGCVYGDAYGTNETRCGKFGILINTLTLSMQTAVTKSNCAKRLHQTTPTPRRWPQICTTTIKNHILFRLSQRPRSECTSSENSGCTGYGWWTASAAAQPYGGGQLGTLVNNEDVHYNRGCPAFLGTGHNPRFRLVRGPHE